MPDAVKSPMYTSLKRGMLKYFFSALAQSKNVAYFLDQLIPKFVKPTQVLLTSIGLTNSLVVSSLFFYFTNADITIKKETSK